jgi:hypothetical protein
MRALDAAIDIAAPPERVWQVISDLPAYVRWNPFIVRAGGELTVGGRLRVTIVAPGHRGVTFRPTILELEPGRSVTWLGRTVLPGLFDGRHTLHPGGGHRHPRPAAGWHHARLATRL